MRVVQEFYCNECQGYFRVPLNMALNRVVVVICPNKDCRHKHHRTIKNGHIVDDLGVGQGHNQSYVEEIEVPPSAYSKQQLFKASQQNQRNGTILRDPSRDILMERWQEIYGDRAHPAGTPELPDLPDEPQSLLSRIAKFVKP